MAYAGKGPFAAILSNPGRVVGMGCLALLAIIVIMFAISAATSTPGSQRIELEASHEVDCERAILAKLKAPTTASFGKWHHDGDTAQGTVTSQNSFSAMLTHRAACTFSGETLIEATVIE